MREATGITLRCGCEINLDGPAIRVVQRCELEKHEQLLQEAYRTIRAFVGDPEDSCPALDCPYEKIVRRAQEQRESV